MASQSLTVVMADEIRRLHDAGLRGRQIAELVGVTIRTVNEVLAGKRTGRALSARERFAADGLAGWAPLCMDADEWADWRDRNPLGAGISEYDQVARPCEECPLGFAADMRAEGRCNGTPGGVREDIDHQEEEHVDPVTQPDPGIRVPVTLEAPCPRCEKADVCGLRPAVEAMASLPVMVPVLDRRLALELTGAVSCSAFARARVRKVGAAEVAKLGGLTPRQDQILAAVVAADGDRKAAAKHLGIIVQQVDSALIAIARKGRIPPELLERLPDRYYGIQAAHAAASA